MKKFLILALMCVMVVCNGEVVRNSRGEKLVSRIEQYDSITFKTNNKERKFRFVEMLHYAYMFKYDTDGYLIGFDVEYYGYENKYPVINPYIKYVWNWKFDRKKNVFYVGKDESGIDIVITANKNGLIEKYIEEENNSVVSCYSFFYDEEGRDTLIMTQIFRNNIETSDKHFMCYYYDDFGNRHVKDEYIYNKLEKSKTPYKSILEYNDEVNDTNIDFSVLTNMVGRRFMHFMLTEWFGKKPTYFLRRISPNTSRINKYWKSKKTGNIEYIYNYEGEKIKHRYRIIYVGEKY